MRFPIIIAAILDNMDEDEFYKYNPIDVADYEPDLCGACGGELVDKGDGMTGWQECYDCGWGVAK